MTFSDIFKTSFLSGYQTADINTTYVLITLAITALIGMYIFLVYRLTCRKVFYSLEFNISLVATSLITATIIFTIQSSIVVSLGMVGALSIIRFRTAIKSPLDLVYLFWSISIGIICGAGLAQFAVILSLLLTVVVVFLARLKGMSHPMILVVSARTSAVEEALLRYLEENFKKYKVRSRTLTEDSFNMVVEISSHEDRGVVGAIEKIEGVYGVSLVDHDGEVTY